MCKRKEHINMFLVPAVQTQQKSSTNYEKVSLYKRLFILPVQSSNAHLKFIFKNTNNLRKLIHFSFFI